MEDLIEQANEIQESLGRSYGVPDEVDEADLQAGQSHVFPLHPAQKAFS
jgi:charged multivesicular body protein 5